MTKNIGTLPDIKPQTPISVFKRGDYLSVKETFPIERVAALVGMSEGFCKKVCGRKNFLNAADVIGLLDQDAFSETFVPRSKILDYLLKTVQEENCCEEPVLKIEPDKHQLYRANAKDLIKNLPSNSIQCVVTSTPYWGMRIYKGASAVHWADGEYCPFGHEQTPEGFIRHTIEILYLLKALLKEKGSIWWNIMDTFNTRTQIRGNAAEALSAMKGNDKRSWSEHECRRYSAGHAYLKDGEQCHIPTAIAQRAARIGFYVKSLITWSKVSTTPEPQKSRVSRSLEYVIHLSKHRTPTFSKDVYRSLPSTMGGRNNGWETDKLSDVWTLQTSSGRDGHGAQFPVSLPARCIALTTTENDFVLDPFVGSGNSGVAARALDRSFIGIDISQEYLDIAERKISMAEKVQFEDLTKQISESPNLEMPL